MNLRSRFRLVIVSMVLLLTSSVAILILEIQHTKLHIQQATDLDELVAKLYELRILSSEHKDVSSERVEQQWRSLHNQIKAKLGEQKNMPAEVKDAVEGLQQTYERLVSPTQNQPESEASQKRLTKQLETTLNLESQRIIDWELDLSSQTKNGIVKHLLFFGAVTFFVMLVIACVMIAVIFGTTRRLFLSIASLKNGAERIASGGLGFQVAQDGNDEIATLAAAINRMSRDLLTSYQHLREQTAQLKQEVSERLVMYETLRQSEERHRMILQTAMDGIWLVSMEGRLLEVNEAYCRLSGYSVQELLALRISDLEVCETNGETAGRIQKIKAQGDFRFESRHRRKDGRMFDVEISAQFQPEEGGRILAFIHDITERKRAEAEHLRAEKLQGLGTLAGGIAHDFNNLLQGLFGNMSIAMEELSKEHPGYAFLEQAEKSRSRAVRLTKQLLTFAKGGAPVKESVSLGELIAEVARFDLSGSKVSLIYRQAEDLWQADADKGQLQQVVSNLVINARQAMPNGGHLTITLENADLPAEAVPALSQGRYVKLTVQDEGVGIEPEVLGQIFDPYFTTKHTGSGLGLATVWSIINKHGGHISVDSEVSKGTTFTLYLPVSSATSPTEPKLPVAERPLQTRAAKLLVMDDEDMVCKIVTKILERGGNTVVSAQDGKEAIALYKQALEAGVPFDAVILDLTIPGGIGGVQAVSALRAIDPNVRAIVSSGYADDPVMANPAAYGIKGVVAKPYTADALREAVARVLS